MGYDGEEVGYEDREGTVLIRLGFRGSNTDLARREATVESKSVYLLFMLPAGSSC